MTNPFGRTSRLSWRAIKKDDKTILTDIYFTAPYKIMHPFAHKDGSISVMQLTASAGVMAGDVAEYDFQVEQGAKIEFLSQSFEKIHRMDEQSARRQTTIKVAKDARFFYHPLPVIPFADSSFACETTVQLEDESSAFEYYEIITCGRVAMGERFAYNHFSSRLHIKQGEKLIFRDNTLFDPSVFPLEQTGFYEGFTHLGNFIFLNRGKDDNWAAKAKELLKADSHVQGGVTRLACGGYLIKILGRQAQKLQELAEKIAAI